MGWLKLSRREPSSPWSTTTLDAPPLSKKDEGSLHLETVDVKLDTDNGSDRPYTFHPVSLDDKDLPFINGDTVRAAKGRSDCLWIVVDEIVYDCTSYVHEHPGGATVISSFQGEDCSWQFWRFHNKSHMKQFGRPLRIGRTKGVVNRFKERPRFVGLRKGNDDW